MTAAAARRSERRPDASAFARRLRERRLTIALTQAEVGQRLDDVTARTIGDWERGASRPAPRHYRALAEFLQLAGPSALIDLIDGHEDVPTAPVLTLHKGATEVETRPDPVAVGLSTLNEFWRSRLLNDARELTEAELGAMSDYTSLLKACAQPAVPID